MLNGQIATIYRDSHTSKIEPEKPTTAWQMVVCVIIAATEKQEELTKTERYFCLSWPDGSVDRFPYDASNGSEMKALQDAVNAAAKRGFRVEPPAVSSFFTKRIEHLILQN
ncbi:hypothetical protein ACFX59_02270 [Sphingomonas sp. NCPPB 2930]|uniref:hypothetical protein n=1 Tax=Sphingomonas sp. NCPPB 2930 TaxID=3162788 RepID=UPI0036D7DAE3